jgi:hypothetical protein
MTEFQEIGQFIAEFKSLEHCLAVVLGAAAVCGAIALFDCAVGPYYAIFCIEKGQLVFIKIHTAGHVLRYFAARKSGLY